MGLGDNIMASGMARGARERGVRIAFGDGRRIIWDQHSEKIFLWNLNVARPGDERAGDLEWVHFYKGHRIYNSLDSGRARWTWNYKFRARPGQVILTSAERDWASSAVYGMPFALVEPNLPEHKACAPNKRWPVEYYQEVASRLMRAGHAVAQLSYGGRYVLRGVHQVQTPTFRHALAALERAAMYVGPEGGLHHGAAALGVPAVVLFGGWIPPQVTGYETHVNLTGGSTEACGLLTECLHCRRAMLSIGPDQVVASARAVLEMRAAS